ncbi:anaerobic ribonucleoside-triphosphate reductase activating protein [Candidatus Falkowbacteria bacterium RIFCSPLOWO2_02_FULL_45_15]|uniref:Anaerobic ribonucleoside-triphosphate reductase activating protein n=2 Tax=Candidatus Falkowiibacteriota TaxID=1752728 RepID=A0A1F5RVN2_9BACT|nr:MAG: anaerobic ribonucleoside-triphosphate reductase activating protein [Candidatus Falkowbacteria bacterium RIFCSPHIGHO2_02_FULL_45_15]OGF18750.1 MAG: anaerobic ribonucleoside-triphosphate reductase activating protein [Candidatus Falkowbacteria bacterium RIFCSPLOWO2_02_FULL_45_15]
MVIGGLQKLTLQDYPDQVAAIIFTQGCNFRCHFCYNPQLVVPNRDGAVEKGHSSLDENGLFGWLRSRQGKLDAVVISGGEPTIHPDLPEFIGRIKRLGYLVKLDTNGTNPEMLARLLRERLLDYVAMDLKAPFDKYESVVGVKLALNKVAKSIKIIMASGLAYEFRTTLVPELHPEQDIAKMGELIAGADKWYLQKFRSNVDLVNREFKNKDSYTDKEMEKLRQIAARYAAVCGVR